MECYGRGKTEALREKRVLLQLCPPQSPHGAAWNRILSSAVSSRRLTSPVHIRQVGLPSAPDRQVFASKCMLRLGSCNTHLRCALLISPSMLLRHSLTQHTILFGSSYLTRNKVIIISEYVDMNMHGVVKVCTRAVLCPALYTGCC